VGGWGGVGWVFVVGGWGVGGEKKKKHATLSFWDPFFLSFPFIPRDGPFEISPF